MILSKKLGWEHKIPKPITYLDSCPVCVIKDSFSSDEQLEIWSLSFQSLLVHLQITVSIITKAFQMNSYYWHTGILCGTIPAQCGTILFSVIQYLLLLASQWKTFFKTEYRKDRWCKAGVKCMLSYQHSLPVSQAWLQAVFLRAALASIHVKSRSSFAFSGEGLH